MQIELTLQTIVQANKRGALQFSETVPDPQPGQRPSVATVAVQVTDPKQTLEFEQGATYKITFEKL